MLFRSQSVHMMVAMLVVASSGYQVQSYSSKDIFADALLTDLLNRMDNDMQVGYYDVGNEAAAGSKDNVDLVSRSEYARLCDGGSDCILQSGSASGAASHPSLRDHEFLQHSSLWGHQFISGGMGEGPNRYPTIVKNDAGLPAYCNPPNPCPEGYDMETQGGSCIVDFENTAIFSREFQAAQDCTCDNEHMFDCSEQDSADVGAEKGDLNSAVEQYIMQMGQENSLNNVNSLVKKAGYPVMPDPRLDDAVMNPFLQGDRLPIAAKKGNLLFH